MAYSQGITVTVGDKVGKAYNSDSLGGKVPAFYVDTLNNQNIAGTKTFKGNIIIGNNRYFGFAGEGLIEQYELDFLNLKIRGVSEAKRRLYRVQQSAPELHWHP